MSEENKPENPPAEGGLESGDAYDGLRNFIRKHQQLRATVKATFDNIVGKKFDRRDQVRLWSQFKSFMEETDDLLLVVVQDFVAMNSRLSEIEKQLFNHSNLISTTTQALNDKNVVTKKDLDETFQNVIKPKLKEKLEELKKKVESELQEEEPAKEVEDAVHQEGQEEELPETD